MDAENASTENQNLIAVVMPNGSLQLEWAQAACEMNRSRVVLQRELFSRFESGDNTWLLHLGFSDRSVTLSASLEYWREWAGLFTARLAKIPELESLRAGAKVPLGPGEARAHLGRAPMATGAEYLSAEVLRAVWQTLQATYAQEIRSHSGTVAGFIKAFSPHVHLIGRIFFHLVENKKGDQPFAFLATYSTRLDREGRSKHVPLKYALQEFKGRPKELLTLLTTVYRAAKRSPMLDDLLTSGRIFYPMVWSPGEALRFLKDIPVYEDAGILCRIPDWWKGLATGVRINITMGSKQPATLGMEAILNFNIDLALGDTALTLQEARALLAESEGLALIKNKWVAVDPEKLRQTLDAYEQAKEIMAGQPMSLADALRMQLNPPKALAAAADGAAISVSNGKWLEEVLGKMRNPRRAAEIKPDRRFKAQLRPYQQQGLNWLNFLHSLGFGACLADDMGLGKTVQVLAFLHRLRSGPKASNTGRPASLLVIPASLLSNWTAEIARFAPDLRYFVAHPSANAVQDPEGDDAHRIDTYDLVITTYALAGRYPWLKAHRWFYIILDEAQAIKNPGTKQARALKAYHAQNRIILTGTPVENRLSDLWSLFDFLNPGLLGSATEFKKFAKRLNEDSSGYAHLRQIVSPYLLRRLKTDRAIVPDLPEKVEMKTYAALSKKQAALYKKLVDDIETAIMETDGMERKGLILASLMKFKQLCNHPDQYLGSGGYAEKESGKFARLRDICETIYAKREKVLVFTQFKELTEPLAAFLSTIFNRAGLVMHGSVPVKQRKKIIDAFQLEKYVPFLVLSLKVGGVGLNLTEANHVIHFDRWWNPAVENQATDRVFRIGQQKNVVVHKFITTGTVEEKIDQMLEQKAKLSDEVVSGGEAAWITEMDNRRLMELFSLSL